MDEPQDRSLDELLEMAKRAQTIIGHLDLEAVARHEPSEVDKLRKIASAVEALDRGEQVDFVPGVDEEEDGPPTIDPRKMRTATLMTLLDASGLGARLGRIYVSDGDPQEKPLDAIPHTDGIPENDLCVAPDYSPTDGVHGIFISDRGVFSVMVPNPVLENRWRIMRSMPYDNDDELVEIVQRYVARPAAGE